FGLLPGIVMHYTFDAVLMSLPIFAASSLRAHIEAFFVVTLILVPLWVVLIARFRTGKWSDLPDELRNGAWTPPPAETPVVRETVVESQGTIHPAVRRLLPIAGFAGLIVWLVISHFRPDAPGIAISRSVAESAARQALAQQEIRLDSP